LAESDGEAVKFFSLVLRSHQEGERWVSENLGECGYGLIVDANLSMEHVAHVYAQVFENEGAIKNLQRLYKLKIDNPTQVLAIFSFESQIPKYFSKKEQQFRQQTNQNLGLI
jgi:hypothetical protein